MDGEPAPHEKDRPILRECWRYVFRDKSNIIIGITGRVGRGKSHTACKIINLWNPKFNPSDYLVYTVDELMERTLSYIKVGDQPLHLKIFDDIPNIKEWLKENQDQIHITPGMPLVFDEAGTGVFVRDFFSQDNKNISKIVQVWRFLRMIVIVVVPENMGIAEKNLRTFMDLEIKMIRVDRQRREATGIAYEFYDKSDPDNPKKQRILGCRYGGKLHIQPLPDELAEEYEKIARIHKLNTLLELSRKKDDKFHAKQGGTRALVPFKDALMVAQEKGATSRSTIAFIANETGCSTAMAVRIKQALRSENLKKSIEKY